jgi:hypothetical protein
MRKTFASTLHHKGLPAQTLQRYLRHSELSTTLAYIADQPDDQVRDTINLTFSGFARVRTVAIPIWVKQGINVWMTAAKIEDGGCFGRSLSPARFCGTSWEIGPSGL